MSTRVRITIDADMVSVAEARMLAEDMATVRNFMRAKYVNVMIDADITAEIDFSYAPQHEHLKENRDATD